ncbi:MAG TPA: DUF368 domain-containing protein [Gammaproteobacteria bacterium]|nr:DUF368 domain-containing protein [Gammaproteobacteria bacterium]
MRHYFILFLKGMAMGIANVIPGVSGGTIALITEIYEELINSLKSFDIKALKLLISFDFREHPMGHLTSGLFEYSSKAFWN